MKLQKIISLQVWLPSTGGDWSLRRSTGFQSSSLWFENLGEGLINIYIYSIYISGKHLVGQGILEKCLLSFHRYMNTLENASGVTSFSLEVYIHSGEENLLFMEKNNI